ncbi:MAG: hypothetical protein ACKVP5_03880, partial [Aestuariivirga sp.]
KWPSRLQGRGSKFGVCGAAGAAPVLDPVLSICMVVTTQFKMKCELSINEARNLPSNASLHTCIAGKRS